MRLRLILFALLLGGGAALEPWSWTQTYVLMPWSKVLANASGIVMHLFGSNVQVQGEVLLDQATDSGIAVMGGCNGAEATLILVCALLVYPSSWRSKLIGMMAGFVAVQGVNVLRLISLFYLYLWNADLFEWVHRYLWQSLIMLDVLVYILLWLRWQERQECPAH
jgi:exosortase H (IPTLxxWG-CTERM-specific)